MHGDWKQGLPRAPSHSSLFPKAGVMGHRGRFASFSQSSPKSQAINLGELERKLIKYTWCVFTATRVRWKPKRAAANDQVQVEQASKAIRSATPVLELSPKIQWSHGALQSKGSSSEETELFGNSLK